jgi:uncharacterized protein (TIGR02246 family)
MTIDEARTIANNNFARWNNALIEKDAVLFANLYTEDNTFLPTLSGEFTRGIAGAKAYGQHFLEKNPVGTVVVDEVQMLSDTCYLHSGMYNFEVGAKDARTVVEARFSYVWVLINDGEWKILHHHSSIRPQG